MLTLMQKSERNLHALTDSGCLAINLKPALSRLVCVLCGIFICGAGLMAQTFQETLGAAADDVAAKIIQTSDGGYVVVGSSDSYPGSGFDIVLTKLDANGIEQWSRRYLGPNDEYGHDVQEVDRDGDGTLDGYAIVGTSKSSGNGDIYLVLTNYIGVLSTTRTYGGSRSEEGYSIVQMDDYGYLLCGMTASYGRPSSSPTSIIPGNVFVVRTDIGLDPLWSTVISSDELTPDYGYSAIETLAGEIMLTGALGGTGNGGKDIAVIQLDQNGAWQWSDFYGSPDDDAGYEIREVINGGVSAGFVVAATVEGLGTGGSDAALLRLDVNGAYLWHRLYGGTNDDAAYSVAFTPAGGFALCGTTNSYGFGSSDVYVVETDANGVQLNSYAYGGTGTDEGRSIRATSGNGYIISGETAGFGAGVLDAYVIKTDGAFFTPCNYTEFASSYTPGPSEVAFTPPWAIVHMACTSDVNADVSISLTENFLCQDCNCNPRPAGFQHSYGAGGDVRCRNISEMSNSDLLIAGESNTYTANQDMYVAKTDVLGNLIWSRVYWPNNISNSTDEYAVAAIELTPNGDIFVVGTTYDGSNYSVYTLVVDNTGAPTGTSHFINPGSMVDAEAVDVQPIYTGSTVTGYMVLAKLTGYTAQPDVYMIEFNTAGTLVKETILDQSFLTDFQPQALAPIDDNFDGNKDDGWVIAGLTTDLGNEGAVVLETDENLVPIWGNIYQLGAPGNHAIGMDIVQIDSDNDGQQDNEYALTGPVEFGGSSTKVFIALIESSGAVVGGTAALYSSGGIGVVSNAITQTCNNNLVITGKHGNTIWQMRTDVSLNSFCATGYANDGQGEELLQTSNQGMAIIGSEFNSGLGSDEAYLVKTSCGCSSGCNEFGISTTQTTDSFAPIAFSVAEMPVAYGAAATDYSAMFFDETTVCLSPMVVLPEESTPVNEYMQMDSQLENIESVNSDSATDVDDETLNGTTLEIYPNPVQNGTDLNVMFNSRTTARVSVKVTNVLGAVIGEYPLNAMPGEQSLQLDTRGWSPGTYTLTLNSSDGAAASSIVVVVR